VRHSISQSKRMVIKIGSSLLVDDNAGMIHHAWLNSLIEDIAFYFNQNQEVIIVSSGAIAIGRRHLKLKDHALLLEEKQAAAAVGQIKLAHAYQEALGKYDISVAQVLLTLEDSENRERYLNAKNTLETLLNLKVVPVINENDTVATAEIRYGDNDRLAARVAQMVSADTLVLLSDIEGLYTADPRKEPKATLIPEVTQLTPEIIAMGGHSATQYGSGGMITKLAAAKIALESGCKMVIAAGKYLHPLKRIDQVKTKTWFVPQLTPKNARKNWIAQHLKPKGTITIDQGAYTALKEGKSLLSVGVIQIQGEFHQGDPISILTEDHKEIAKGLINYSAQDAKKIMRKKSSEFADILGYPGSDEIIHRDDLVLLAGEKT